MKKKDPREKLADQIFNILCKETQIEIMVNKIMVLVDKYKIEFILEPKSLPRRIKQLNVLNKGLTNLKDRK